ncbi:MAG: hypothetical protein ABI784_02135, partial [Ginsengibacter sp.]
MNPDTFFMDTIEIHPHKFFVPSNAQVIIIGSFPGRGHATESDSEWFYESKRNQFWKIISAVYQRELYDVTQKKNLFTEKGIAIGDLFYKVKRTKNNNSDSSLQVIEYNDKALSKIFKTKKFQNIFFTSKFIEKEFKKLFPVMENIASLPSPSPRVATIS